MAGIYVHIPFCKSRCLYCDFYSTTSLALREQYVDALIREYALRKHELPEGEPVRTIYLGGGTPSMLEEKDLARLLQALPLEDAEEVTMEVNPSDVTPVRLNAWRHAGIKRLSIGVQSFEDKQLHVLGRRHNGMTACQALTDARKHGFKNISVDLIYGIPGQSVMDWEYDVRKAIAYNVQHISTYCLTYEEHTPLYAMRESGQITEISEDVANFMYSYACNLLKQAGYVHYEVSNFSLPGYESKHNSSYWNGTPYLGLGAGAHSYDGKVRRANIPDIAAYLKGIATDTVPHEIETLTETDRYNEEIMLGLRTARGIDATLDRLAQAQQYIEKGLLRHDNGKLIATQDGINILNRIIEDLMI